METIISSLITGAVSLAVCLLTMKKHREESLLRSKEQVDLMAYKIDELSKRVEKHNNVIERTYALERQTTLLEEKIKVANNRIEDLENI